MFGQVSFDRYTEINEHASCLPDDASKAPLRGRARLLSRGVLAEQNRRYCGTKAVSQRNRKQGFLPAFRDRRTGTVYLSRFADGRVAPIHLLDGLPPHLVTKRSTDGRVSAVSHTVTAGFVRGDRFYTREQARSAAESEAN